MHFDSQETPLAGALQRQKTSGEYMSNHSNCACFAAQRLQRNQMCHSITWTPGNEYLITAGPQSHTNVHLDLLITIK